MWGTAVLILWSRCPCSLVDKGSWTGAIFWRSFCDVTLTSNVISSRLGSTLSGQMIRIRDRLIGSQSSQKCQSFLLGGSFYSASEIPWGRIGVNGSTWAYSNTLIFIGPKSNHRLSLSVTNCCKLQCNAMYTIHGYTYKTYYTYYTLYRWLKSGWDFEVGVFWSWILIKLWYDGEGGPMR